MMPAWLAAVLLKMLIAVLESMATSIAKKDAPAVVARLQAVTSNIKTFHDVDDFPKGKNGA